MSREFTLLESMIPATGRIMRRYYDIGLEGFRIGWGQQFYLEYIYENPGVTPQEVTARFHIDKGTTTKVLKKLGAEGYIRAEVDSQDRRIHHLYACEGTAQAVERIRSLHVRLHEAMIRGMEAEEIERLERNLCLINRNIQEEVRAMKAKKADGADGWTTKGGEGR